MDLVGRRWEVIQVELSPRKTFAGALNNSAGSQCWHVDIKYCLQILFVLKYFRAVLLMIEILLHFSLLVNKKTQDFSVHTSNLPHLLAFYVNWGWHSMKRFQALTVDKRIKKNHFLFYFPLPPLCSKYNWVIDFKLLLLLYLAHCDIYCIFSSLFIGCKVSWEVIGFAIRLI